VLHIVLHLLSSGQRIYARYFGPVPSDGISPQRLIDREVFQGTSLHSNSGLAERL